MEKYFRTTDNDLAAFLETVGYKSLDITLEKGKFLAFQFPDSPELQKAVRDFYSNSTKVDARTLCENVRKMKVILTSFKHNQMGGGGQR